MQSLEAEVFGLVWYLGAESDTEQVTYFAQLVVF